MAKRMHLNFLQYILDHQNPSDNYLNRYFVVKDRLGRKYGYSEHKINIAKTQLLNSGLLRESMHPGQLYLTEEGKKFLHQENKTHLMSFPERFTQFFNKKLVAFVTILGALIAAFGPYNDAQKKPSDNLSQFLSVSLINIKRSIFN